MKPRRRFRPDLGECVLEDRLPPAISNLGVIVLTTGGYMLLIPFPGAFVPPASLAGGFGAPGAAGVSGTPINTPFFVMGSGGLSSVLPGNITGFPSLGLVGPTGSTGSPTAIIRVGSGASDAAAMNIPPVTRNTIANDLLNPRPMIGGRPSGNRFAVTYQEQISGGTTLAPSPTTAAPPPTSAEPSTSPPQSGASSNPLSPYPPSVVPLVFPFKPPAGSPMSPRIAPPGSFPGGPTPIPPGPSPGAQPSGPNPGDGE